MSGGFFHRNRTVVVFTARTNYGRSVHRFASPRVLAGRCREFLPLDPIVDVTLLEAPGSGNLESGSIPPLGKAIDGLSSTFR